MKLTILPLPQAHHCAPINTLLNLPPPVPLHLNSLPIHTPLHRHPSNYLRHASRFIRWQIMLLPHIGEFGRHACLYEPWTDGVDADVRGTREREAEGAHEAYYAVLACLPTQTALVS
jgi:hypothetical protein